MKSPFVDSNIISSTSIRLRFSGSSPVYLLQHILIEESPPKNDIFFDKSFIQHYLTAHSLGASTNWLQTIYNKHESYLGLEPESLGNLTKENYCKYLGQCTAYKSSLDFFKDEIEKYVCKRLQIDLLAQYNNNSSSDNIAVAEEENFWFGALHQAFDAKEAHIIKSIRTLALAQIILYGKNPVSTLNLVQIEEQVQDILLKDAQVTLDIPGRSSDLLVSWDLAVIGIANI
ncbi:hypothetical protein BDA99DRAFT_540660 [Phascolomyces articulosus]|uniref:Uncharacterized protein n=1 Tax=Phascolomyces articulosus TaxID=60185 RepID=A0AAD5K402_9FUNG|nr:hypothetical protein BDA99DRAFT_540660 [Phascolomyces articulosus]